MILQRIQKKLQQDELYLRHKGTIEKYDEKLILNKGARLETNTYFNACSVGKWFTYCEIDEIELTIAYSGKIRVEVVFAYEIDGKCVEETICAEKICADKKKHFTYQISKIRRGLVYFIIEALEDGAILYDAEYQCQPQIQRDITIALNICTYKREQYLMRNLTLLQQNFLNNNDSELYNNLKVFITDNGNTLDCQQLSNNGNVFACHNPNVGGAGGFTRGVLEILKYKEKKKITNVIFMDDDVEIEPESIRRTYALLSLMKEEYRNAFISGAMLCLDKKYLQHENGALWNQGKCKFVGRGIDLREFSNVVLNEVDKKRDYAAWWYCCIPIEIVQYDNLPIPVFIHQDDTEYSLRNTKTIITMNGIAIWHPVATHIRTSANEYYNLRNLLIVNSIYCPEYQKKQVRKKMFTNLLVALLRMRYNDMDLIYRALEDFCKGPEWLLNLDAVAYHKEIQQAGYQFSNMQARIKDKVIQDCSSLEENSIRDRYKASQKKLWYILRIASLNGWLLPGKKKQQIHYMNVHPFDLYRTKKVILYDDVSGSGIEVRRDFFKLFSFIWIYFKSLYLILCKYKKSKDAYNRMFLTLTNIEYWNRVLEIENK